jgi:DNA repair protein RadA/Sms
MKGLLPQAGADAPIATLESVAEETSEPVEVTRPRLVIARPQAPEPELTDPVEELVDIGGGSSAAPIPLSEVLDEDVPRDLTGLAPLDAVLGGGLAVGSAIVLGGAAGIGKSSLIMQMLAGLGLRCLLATGEESVRQAAARARRIKAASRRVFIIAETDLETVLKHAHSTRCQVLHVDSIQTLYCAEASGSAGSPAQIKECTHRLMLFAKKNEVSVILTAHQTTDGALSGPAALRHLVDVVLELEEEPSEGSNQRVLRASKNRFGSTAVKGRFELTESGLVPIDGDGWDKEQL